MDRLEEIKKRAAANEAPWESPAYAPSDVHWLISEVESLRRELAVSKEIQTAEKKILIEEIEKSAAKGATICGMREALEFAENHCPCGARPESLKTHPHMATCLIGNALSSSPTCPHKEEVEKQINEGFSQRWGTLMQRVAGLQAELASLREVARAIKAIECVGCDIGEKFDGDDHKSIYDGPHVCSRGGRAVAEALSSHEAKWGKVEKE